VANKFIYSLILFSCAAIAEPMTQMERNTIDRYITEHLPGGLTPREQALKELQDRANKIDAGINPMLAVRQRGYDLLKEETVYNDNAEKNLSEGLFRINPYDDKTFKQSTIRSMHELCCTIKTDRDWIGHIQERVAQGLPPLESESNQAPADLNRPGAQPNARAQGPRRRGGAGGGQPRMRRGPGPGGAQRGMRQRGGMRRGQGQNQQPQQQQ
jgi:hypothetical protein